MTNILCHPCCSELLTRFGEAKRATCLLAASKTALDAMGAIRQPVSVQHFQTNVDKVRENLSEELFEKAWAEGSVMTLDEAVTYALRE